MKLRAIVAALLALLFTAAAAPVPPEPEILTSEQAIEECEADSRIVNIPFHWKYGRYRNIGVQVVSYDCGHYRYWDVISIRYDTDVVSHLEDVWVRSDDYGNNTNYQTIGVWSHMYMSVPGWYELGYSYCYDPCNVIFTGRVWEIGAPDDVVSGEFGSEGDDTNW